MEQLYRRVVSGQQAGIFATLARGFAGVIEPIYRAVISSRNSSYSSGLLRSVGAQRPVISVGNITTGGTGKTPVVRWLAEQLRARGLNVAILLRGYKSTAARSSDERELLQKQLNSSSENRPVLVHANPDRVEGATQVLQEHPEVDLFILDDGFQHRRIKREFDLVLIDATNPFGYDHVLPRGLLREPLQGLARASAVLLTRVDQSLPGELEEILACLKQHAPRTPVYRCNHVQHHLVAEVDGTTVTHPIEWLRSKRVLAFAGIGNPEAFETQLRAATTHVVAARWFGDHHSYQQIDLDNLFAAARTNGADVLVTTEKDWVKLAPIATRSITPVPILRAQLETQFSDADAKHLLEQILRVVKARRSMGES